MINPVPGKSMDQWYFISIAVNAQNCINKKSCIDSFKKFNIHPHTLSTFDVWIRKLDDHGFLSAKTFFENRTTLYDTIPAFCKKFDFDQRQAVMGVISDAYNSTPSNQNVWSKQKILSLAIFFNT